MDVSENSGTPKSSILIGFSIINHPFWGTIIFGNTHMLFVVVQLHDSATGLLVKHTSEKPQSKFNQHILNKMMHRSNCSINIQLWILMVDDGEDREDSDDWDGRGESDGVRMVRMRVVMSDE